MAEAFAPSAVRSPCGPRLDGSLPIRPPGGRKMSGRLPTCPPEPAQRSERIAAAAADCPPARTASPRATPAPARDGLRTRNGPTGRRFRISHADPHRPDPPTLRRRRRACLGPPLTAGAPPRQVRYFLLPPSPLLPPFHDPLRDRDRGGTAVGAGAGRKARARLPCSGRGASRKLRSCKV
jgi:hypothetical protein